MSQLVVAYEGEVAQRARIGKMSHDLLHDQ